MEGKDAKCISRGIKQIIVIDMANIGTRMWANKGEGKQARQQTNKQKGKQAKGGVREGQM